VRKTAIIILYDQISSYSKLFLSKKTVLVGGCFDILHFGHLKFLQKSAEEGNFLIVALESDEFIKKYKRKPPIHSQLERAEILSHLSFVDMIVLLPLFKNDRDYFDLVKRIKPSIIAITKGDPMFFKKTKQGELIKAKIKIVINNLNRFSTTKIAKVFNL
jgi:cytidyltransferase-like protein